MNPDYRIVQLTCVTKNNVSLITGEDGNGKITTEAMITSMNIALLVALFLLNSDHIQKAIEICNECLILLNNSDQNSKDQFDSVLLQFDSDIYTVLYSAYRHISDYVNAERYGRKLHVFYSKYGILFYKLGENLKAKGERTQEPLSYRPKLATKAEKHPIT